MRDEAPTNHFPVNIRPNSSVLSILVQIYLNSGGKTDAEVLQIVKSSAENVLNSPRARKTQSSSLQLSRTSASENDKSCLSEHDTLDTLPSSRDDLEAWLSDNCLDLDLSENITEIDFSECE